MKHYMLSRIFNLATTLHCLVPVLLLLLALFSSFFVFLKGNLEGCGAVLLSNLHKVNIYLGKIVKGLMLRVWDEHPLPSCHTLSVLGVHHSHCHTCIEIQLSRWQAFTSTPCLWLCVDIHKSTLLHYSCPKHLTTLNLQNLWFASQEGLLLGNTNSHSTVLLKVKKLQRDFC